MRQILDFIQPGLVTHPVTIFEDNGGAIYLVDNPIYTSRTKHIDVRYHVVREKVAVDMIKSMHVESRRQTMDCLTKNLLEAILICHRNLGTCGRCEFLVT